MQKEEKEDSPCFKFEINLETHSNFCCSYFNLLDSYQILIGSDMLLEPAILVRHMIFINPKGHAYYLENFRSETYELNKSHFLVKL